MTPDTTLQLGDFTFSDFAVPEHLPFGGEQTVVVHKLIGGVRVVDVMGRDDQAITWSGIFLGKDALVQARYLDSLSIAGKPLVLSWSEFKYTVVVRRFEGDFHNFHRIPFSISCEIVDDQSVPITDIIAADLNQQIADDLGVATTTGGSIGDSFLNALIADVNAAVAKVQDFVTATKQELAAVAAPLLATQQQVRSLIAAASPLVDDVVALGGVVPFAPFGQAAVKLQEQVEGFANLQNLYQLQSYLGRIATNVEADGVSGRIVTMAGGDLYHLAANEYGDASAWTAIARANNLTDPELTGVNTLTVPPASDNADGILAA